MKGYVLVVEKNNSLSNYYEKIKETFAKFYKKTVNLTQKSNGNMTLYNFTNEDNDLIFAHDPYYFGVSGDFLEDENSIFSKFILSSNKDDYISKTGGIFTFAAMHERKFALWNNVTRVDPVYWCETPERIVVGTKALLVHLLSFNLVKPEYDIRSFLSFLNNGFYCDEKTPFAGVNVLQNNSKFEIIDDRIKIKPIDNFENDMYSEVPNKKYFDEITDLFLDSFKFLKKSEKTYTLGLTGGKDSRLIVSAMNKLGLDINTVTNGYEDTPDVIIAKEIAGMLDLPHQVKMPSKGDPCVNVNFYSRTSNIIKHCEGMLYSYENISGLSSNVFNNNKIQLGGQGGEILRGGYAKNVNISNQNQLQNHMFKGFLKYGDFFYEESLKEYKDFLNGFIEKQPKHFSFNDVLNKFYLHYRCGRWSGTARSAYKMGFNIYSPMFESRLVKKAQKLKTKYGANEQLIFNILSRVSPELVNVPFANDRWAFEKNAPYSRYDVEEWIKRKPVYPKTQQGNFNWRKNVLLNYRNHFREVIFSDDNSPLFDILDKKKLISLFDDRKNNSAAHDTLLWSLYTSSVLLSNTWFDNSKKFPQIKINIPEKKTVDKIVLDEIRLISANHIRPANKKVNIVHHNNISAVVEWKNYEKEDRLYFQIFDNSFAQPPSEKYKKDCSIRGKELEVHFEIEKYKMDNILLDVYFIQYNDSKRVGSDKFTLNIAEQRDLYKIKLSKNDNASQYKIAFMLKDCPVEGRINLHQLRISTYI